MHQYPSRCCMCHPFTHATSAVSVTVLHAVSDVRLRRKRTARGRQARWELRPSRALNHRSSSSGGLPHIMAAGAALPAACCQVHNSQVLPTASTNMRHLRNCCSVKWLQAASSATVPTSCRMGTAGSWATTNWHYSSPQLVLPRATCLPAQDAACPAGCCPPSP